MDDKATVEELRNEFKLLKNEIRETLSDIRDYLLTNLENPFPTELTREAPPRQEGERPAAQQVQPLPQQIQPLPQFIPQVQPQFIPQVQPQFIPQFQSQFQPLPQQIQPPPQQVQPLPQVVPGAPSGSAREAQGVPGPAPGSPGGAQVRTPAAETLQAEVPRELPQAEEGEDDTPAARSRPAGRGRDGGGREAEPAASRASRLKSLPLLAKTARPASQTKGSETQESEEERASMEPGDGKATYTEPGDGLDLVTVVTLAPWMERGVSRIGREGVKVVLDVYGALGRLSPELKEVLLKLLSLDGSDGSVRQVSIRESLRVLVDLDNLVRRSRSDRSGAALLSALLNDE